MRRVGPLAALVALTVAAALSARVPEAGAEWRFAFVAAMLVAAPVAWWAARSVQPSLRVLIGVALLLRVVALPLAPTLSDDGYRYLWDGALTLDGRSPYADTPRHAIEEGFQPPVPLEKLNSPDYYSVYPPVSQAAFAFALWLGGSFGSAWILFKALVVAVELGGLWALARAVRPSTLALYAWHPVAVLEIAGQGHTEGLAVGLMSASLAAVLAKREALAGAMLALAGWVKLWPFALVAVVVKQKWKLYASFLIVAVGAAVPWVVGAELSGALGSLALYGGTFDFYAAPYLLVKGALWPLAESSSGRITTMVLGGVSLFALAVIATKSNWTLRARVGAATCALVLLSSTLHPWHLLPALWGASLLGKRMRWPVAWLVSIAPVTYLVYVGLPWAMTAALIVGWGGGLALVLIQWQGTVAIEYLLQRRARAKWCRIRRLLCPSSPLRLLDLGCAEGYVGGRAALDGHSVLLADLSPDCEFELPFVQVSPEKVPLPDEAVDVVLLVFVLHHAADPVQPLREAIRVSDGRIVVWETVPALWFPRPLLQMTDQLINSIRPSSDMLPAQLRTTGDWEATFDLLGLEWIARERWGVFHPQVLWVLERKTDLADG